MSHEVTTTEQIGSKWYVIDQHGKQLKGPFNTSHEADNYAKIRSEMFEEPWLVPLVEILGGQAMNGFGAGGAPSAGFSASSMGGMGGMDWTKLMNLGGLLGGMGGGGGQPKGPQINQGLADPTGMLSRGPMMGTNPYGMPQSMPMNLGPMGGGMDMNALYAMLRRMMGPSGNTMAPSPATTSPIFSPQDMWM